MKKLEYYNGFYGYYKQAIIIEGWGNLGPICHICDSIETAKEIKKEYEVEDEAKCLIKKGFVFKNLFKVGSEAHREWEEKKKEREQRKAPGIIYPKYKVILYSWDNSILCWGYIDELSPILEIMGPGYRLVAWNKNGWKETYEGALSVSDFFIK